MPSECWQRSSDDGDRDHECAHDYGCDRDDGGGHQGGGASAARDRAQGGHDRHDHGGDRLRGRDDADADDADEIDLT